MSDMVIIPVKEIAGRIAQREVQNLDEDELFGRLLLEDFADEMSDDMLFELARQVRKELSTAKMELKWEN
jgi:hypothetical protein